MERLLADIVRKSDPRKFDMHVLVLQYLGRFSQEMEGFATLHQGAPQPRYSMLWPDRLARQIGSIAPDVVHSHSGVWYKAALGARMAGVRRVIHTEHGRRSPDPLQARLIDGMASRQTQVAVGVSDVVGDALRRSVVRGSCEVNVILNGVDTELHAPLADDGRLRAELRLPDETPIIGSIGRLEHIKGYDYMVEAFARLRLEWSGSAPPPVLVIAGDGAERERLDRQAREAGVQESIHFLGWRDDVRSLLSAFDVFAMSSRSEGTSVSLLEAMSTGLCPVVTDVGGNAAVLGGGLRHRLVAAADTAGLVAAWKDALTDSARRAADGAAARVGVQGRYSLEQMVQGYHRLYLDGSA
jgi:glycosyltransferase involved in cell wall biosynthesis